MNLSMVEIVFKVRWWRVNFISLQKYTDNDTFTSKVYAEVRIGEEIRVSGNAPVLGCNDPNRAIPMFTTPHDFPWWRSKEGNQINVNNSYFCIRIHSTLITRDFRLCDFAHHFINFYRCYYSFLWFIDTHFNLGNALHKTQLFFCRGM